MRLSYGWPGGGVGRCRFKNALPRFPKQPLTPLGIEVRAVMRVVGHRHVGQFLALRDPPRIDPVAQRLADGGMRGIVGEVVCFVRSEEHTSELQSLMRISYAVFCLKKKTKQLN